MTVAAVGYASIPAELEPDGPEASAQRRAIEAACEQLDLRLVELVCDRRDDGGDGDPQPGLLRTLDRIDRRDATCLIVSDLQHLGRRVEPLAEVLDRLEKRDARLVALDVGLDTATESGRLAVTRGSAAAPAEQPAPEPELEPEPKPKLEPKPEPEPEPEPEPGPQPPPAPEKPSSAHTATAMRAIGYATVPADLEGHADALRTQGEAIERRCRELGIELVEVVREREPRTGKALDRAGLSFLIERVAAGDAGCLVVTGLERLSRSVAELGGIVQWLEQNSVRLIAVELDFDTAGPGGHTTARALASVADLEHERLSEQTRKGLAAARSRRRAASGAAGVDYVAIRRRIATMRADGMTLQAIADVLNAEGVPTQRGGAKWRPSSVQSAAGYRRRAKKVGDLPPVARDKRPS
ncbi:MAG TPA: recombinase family protein [Thermoleophilaceae bacterium]|jgi:DNA invertase Pin-like site-specific DNA recombinase